MVGEGGPTITATERVFDTRSDSDGPSAPESDSSIIDEWDGLRGGGGCIDTGALRSDDVLSNGTGGSSLELRRGAIVAASVGVKSANETVCGVLCPTSLPCRCFGKGGGGAFFLVSALPSVGIVLPISNALSASYELRGEDIVESAGLRSNDGRDREDVSAKSSAPGVRAIEAAVLKDASVELTEDEGVAFPVISSRLKESTSIACFEVLLSVGVDRDFMADGGKMVGFDCRI